MRLGCGAPRSRETRARRAARGQAILFCDADDVMGEGYIEAMGVALERHQFVACRYDFTRLNTSWLDRGARQCQGGQAQGLGGGYCHPTLPYAGAGGLGIAKAVHDAVNGFDTTLKAMAGQEDTDYCIRVQLAGTPLVFVPEAVMHVRFRETVTGVSGRPGHGRKAVRTFSGGTLPTPPSSFGRIACGLRAAPLAGNSFECERAPISRSGSGSRDGWADC